MLLEKMSKEELIEALKPYVLKCNENINLEGVKFSKGHHYLFDQNEGGNWIFDDDGNSFDLCELEHEYDIDIINVFKGV